MADYRDWCGFCGNEINFGYHKPDCEWLKKQRQARIELDEFNSALFEEYRDKSDDDILEEASQLWDDINALGSMQNSLNKKWEFLRYELMDKRLIEKFRERTGRRYA